MSEMKALGELMQKNQEAKFHTYQIGKYKKNNNHKTDCNSKLMIKYNQI